MLDVLSGRSAPGGSNIEPRGGPNGLLEASGSRWPPRPLWKRSWAALGAVLAALGLLLAPLWAVLALPGGPRDAPGGFREGLREAILVLFWMVQRPKLKKRPKLAISMILEGFLVRIVALIFALFLLAWHASGEAANIEKSWSAYWVLVGRKLFVRLCRHRAGQDI